MKRIFLSALIVFVLIFSVTSIQAADANMTDSDAISSEDNCAFQLESDSELNNILTDADDAPLSQTLKNQTELTSPTKTTYYYGSYKVTLKDSNNTLANKTIDFVINNVRYNATTDGNGVASINLKLNPGKYTSSIYFTGDNDYENCSLTSAFEILPTVKSGDFTKYYKGTAQYSATFFDSNGNALANRQVNIIVNGKSYSKKTNSKGVVSLAMNMKPGTYNVVSTDPITGYRISNTVRILSTITSANIKKVEGDNRKFKVKFFKSNGKPLAKKYVKLKIKGKTYKLKTNSKGHATSAFKNLKKGTYNVVCYNNGLSVTYKIKVYKKKASTKLSVNSHTFLPDDNKVIKIRLSTALDDNSNSGKTIKIKINGKTYSKKTDKDGVVNFKASSLKKGFYTVEYKYDGNKFFKASKSTRYLTILDTSQTKITAKGTTHFGYGAGTLMKVSYTAGGVPLIKKSVTLTVAGKSYTKTTDLKGIVSVPIDLDIGEYVVDYKTEKDSKVNGTSGSFDIDVFKRNPSKIVWKCGSSFKDNAQYFKVLVTDSNGKHVSGGLIELTVDGETYHSKVSSDGYAKFKSSVALGKYKVSVKYNGNNNFLPSSKVKSINVKLSKFSNGINERNAKAISAYLKSSSHCHVGAKKIKSMVKALTSGLTNDIDKAKAIFNYVRDTLDYSYYYDTKYGSTKTLKYKKGNCVDHSHLLVAMFRTAGFNARYVHGVCKFSDGDVTGHVWTQVKIGKNWVCADAVSYRNSLGKVKNWNTKSYHINAKYSSLPF